MNTEDALKFLSQHQPMPDDNHVLENNLLKTYTEIIDHFTFHPDPRCVPLFLNSFGDSDGFGVYQLVESVLSFQSKELVIECLIESLQSPNTHIRNWSASISGSYPDPRLYPLLADIAQHGSTSDERQNAFGSLLFYRTQDANNLIENLIFNETDFSTRETYLSMFKTVREIQDKSEK